MITEQEAEVAFSFHQKIKENEQKRRELLAENAKLLSVMKKKDLYKAILGDEKGEWSGYLGQVEVMYSRNDVYNMIRIYDKFVTELGMTYEYISDIPKSRLIDLLPIVNNAEEADEWLNRARQLTNQDWQIEIREAKGLPTQESCQHDLKKYEICSHCGLKHKIDKDEERVHE